MPTGRSYENHLSLHVSLLTSLACKAALIFVCDSHARIVDRVKVGLKSDLIVDLGRPNLSHRHGCYRLRREQTELEGLHAVLIGRQRLHRAA